MCIVVVGIDNLVWKGLLWGWYFRLIFISGIGGWWLDKSSGIGIREGGWLLWWLVVFGEVCVIGNYKWCLVNSFWCVVLMKMYLFFSIIMKSLGSYLIVFEGSFFLLIDVFMFVILSFFDINLRCIEIWYDEI